MVVQIQPCPALQRTPCLAPPEALRLLILNASVLSVCSVPRCPELVDVIPPKLPSCTPQLQPTSNCALLAACICQDKPRRSGCWWAGAIAPRVATSTVCRIERIHTTISESRRAQRWRKDLQGSSYVRAPGSPLATGAERRGCRIPLIGELEHEDYLYSLRIRCIAHFIYCSGRTTQKTLLRTPGGCTRLPSVGSVRVDWTSTALIACVHRDTHGLGGHRTGYSTQLYSPGGDLAWGSCGCWQEGCGKGGFAGLASIHIHTRHLPDVLPLDFTTSLAPRSAGCVL